MSRNSGTDSGPLAGHALRNANLRARSLARARTAPPLAQALVALRAEALGMTRLEFARQSGVSRGALRDLELGVHVPTRRTLQRFLDFCRQRGAPAERLEEVQRLYAGAGEGMGPLIARLELRAGSPAELARRAGVSPATLWEYRRGNFPLPLAVLRRLYQAVGEDPAPAEGPWLEAERHRLQTRGYPEALAEFWALCAREGYSDRDLPSLGLRTAALRRLRYLELPAWEEMAEAARAVCRSEQERLNLERLWRREEQERCGRPPDAFGALLRQFRKQKGMERREVADLFGVGGKKPARIVKVIEEDGCYSARAYPAGLAALLAGTAADETRLLELWRQRRTQFHLRHRPETRIDLRLARELYGFQYRDVEPILGYTPLEYQRIERGAVALSEPGLERILQAFHAAGRRRVEALLHKRDARDAEREAWRNPPSVRALVERLARREGGVVPLARRLRQSGVVGVYPARLRAISRGEEAPAWPLVERIGLASGVTEMGEVRHDWRQRCRARLQAAGAAPLGVEVRLLVAETAETLRAFSRGLDVSASMLTRDLRRMDLGRPVPWARVEQILRAAGLPADDRRREQIYAWWYTTLEAPRSHDEGRPERNGRSP